VRVSRWVLAAGVVVTAAAVAVGTALGSAKAPTAKKSGGFVAALVSDIAGFNDNGFNKNQLKGLQRAAKKFHLTAKPLVSKSASDYKPNYNAAVRGHAKLVIAAGFLLAPTITQYAAQFKNVDFAITDDPVCAAKGCDFSKAAFKKNHATYYVKNIEGITYATQEAGCLVGVLAAKEAQKMGKKVIGAVGGIKIPPVDSYIAGYQYCAKKAVPGTKVLDQYSNSFTDESACSTVAQNEIGQGAQVVFQVAGLCGDGALKEASKLGKWGIGVDADEYKVASRILTSAVKKTDVGVYDVVKQVVQGKFKGGSNILLNLKNKGVGVGRISPKVPKAWITLMNSYKAKIIAGKLKPPAVLK
jgi:basic membrane protein A and related proteins